MTIQAESLVSPWACNEKFFPHVFTCGLLFFFFTYRIFFFGFFFYHLFLSFILDDFSPRWLACFGWVKSPMRIFYFFFLNIYIFFSIRKMCICEKKSLGFYAAFCRYVNFLVTFKNKKNIYREIDEP